MPLVTNYGTLKTQVAATLHRSDLADQMDNAAVIAASEISSIGDSWLLTKFDVIDDAERYVPGGPEYGLPQDFLGILELFSGPVVDILGNIAGTNVIGFQSLDKTALWTELRNNAPVIPSANYLVTPDLGTLRFSAIPDVGTLFVIYYRTKLLDFVNDASTNFVLTTNPQLYIYGMCKHLAIFTQNLELASTYNDLFSAALSALASENERGIDKGPIQIQGASNFH